MDVPSSTPTIQRRVAVSAIAIGLATCLTACGGDDSKEPDPIPIHGGERLAWNQAAGSVQALRAHTFRLYVDGSLAQFANARCEEASTAAGYECSGRLPNMSPGRHVLEMTSVMNGDESPRSSPLTVMFSSSSQSTATAPSTLSTRPGDSASAAAACASTSGACYDVRVVARDLNGPTDLTPTPDGRLFFVEGGRYVRVIDDGTLLPDSALALSSDPASRIVGLAADTAFDRTRAFFVAWTETTGAGVTLVNITRYREVNNSLGEGAQIVTGLSIPADARVPLAVDADGLLYAALPGDSDAARNRAAQAAFAGVVLRFDRDGLTPRANPRPSPIVSNGYAQPTALAIDAINRRVWLGGLSAGRPSVASFTIPPRDAEPGPIHPTLVVTSAFENRSQVQLPGPGLAVAESGVGSSLLLAASNGLFLAAPAADGRLAALERLGLDQGLPLAVANAFGAHWYLVVRTDQGTGMLLTLRRRR